jgi:azurin
MTRRRLSTILCDTVLGAMFASSLTASSGPSTSLRTQNQAPPRILLDQPLRAVEYQLDRLTNEELVLVERRDSDLRYRPVYFALLTRKNLPAPIREEAVAALTKMDKASRSAVLLGALARIPAEDAATAGKLLELLLGQPADTLRSQRDTFAQAIGGSSGPFVLRGAYGALVIADGKPDQAWQAALGHDGHLIELLRSVRHLGNMELRARLFTPIATLAAGSKDAVTRAEALEALGWTRRDAATFDLLAQEVIKGTDANSRAAAIRSLQLIPERSWPAGAIEPLARAIVTMVRETAADRRTEAAGIEAIQLGERLATALPDEPRRLIRRDLRAMGVKVVRIATVPEQMLFDLKWFAVEAGKPIQIVLENPDAMPHNLVVSAPGSLKEVGTAGGLMPLPTDPDVKPYVPNTPLVLQATRLLSMGETARLNFTAPGKPGEYVYVCTFPGHWIRMYGVMLVVETLEAWEAKPTVPTDPMTNRPFPAQRELTNQKDPPEGGRRF